MKEQIRKLPSLENLLRSPKAELAVLNKWINIILNHHPPINDEIILLMDYRRMLTLDHKQDALPLSQLYDEHRLQMFRPLTESIKITSSAHQDISKIIAESSQEQELNDKSILMELSEYMDLIATKPNIFGLTRNNFRCAYMQQSRLYIIYLLYLDDIYIEGVFEGN